MTDKRFSDEEITTFYLSVGLGRDREILDHLIEKGKQAGLSEKVGSIIHMEGEVQRLIKEAYEKGAKDERLKLCKEVHCDCACFEVGKQTGRDETIGKRLVCAKVQDGQMHGEPLEYCHKCVSNTDYLQEKIADLEAELKDWKEINNMGMDKGERVKEENARLRESLKTARKNAIDEVIDTIGERYCEECDAWSPVDTNWGHLQELRRQLKAKKALEEKKKVE